MFFTSLLSSVITTWAILSNSDDSSVLVRIFFMILMIFFMILLSILFYVLDINSNIPDYIYKRMTRLEGKEKSEKDLIAFCMENEKDWEKLLS